MTIIKLTQSANADFNNWYMKLITMYIFFNNDTIIRLTIISEIFYIFIF